VTEAEVSAAANQQLARIAYARDGSGAIAGSINECIAAGDWTLFYTLEDAYRKVTPADVKRVANQYLVEDQSTNGWFIPLTPAAGTAAQ
jgi:zinc protease